MQVNEFKANELCSRKLQQLVNGNAGDRIDAVQLQQAINELTKRRRHLDEMCRENAAGPATRNN